FTHSAHAALIPAASGRTSTYGTYRTCSANGRCQEWRHVHRCCGYLAKIDLFASEIEECGRATTWARRQFQGTVDVMHVGSCESATAQSPGRVVPPHEGKWVAGRICLATRPHSS